MTVINKHAVLSARPSEVLRLALIISCLAGFFPARSQVTTRDYPVIGQPIPEFRLTNVRHYPNRTFAPGEVKGKWIVMDFWYKGCTSCVRSFPKLDQLQNEFKDQVQFLLVGKNDKKNNGDIEQIFEYYRKNLGLNLAIAYDSVLFSRFEISSAPHVIILDPQSKVYAITLGSELTSANLQALVENKSPTFKTKYYDFEVGPEPSNRSWKYRVDENETAQRDFIYRSILSAYRGEPMSGSWAIEQFATRGLYQVMGASLSQLYKIAYFGEGEWGKRSWGGESLYLTHWNDPILEIKDSAEFQFGDSDSKGRYNYCLTIPGDKATKAHLMEMMQRDLKNYFGYKISLEIRKMPYWKLTATDEARIELIAKGGTFEESGPTGIKGRGIAVENILNLIELYNRGERPFADETGIKGRIDINFSAVMTDMEDVRRALSKHGLTLEKSKKEFMVLVIRDPKPEDKNN